MSWFLQSGVAQLPELILVSPEYSTVQYSTVQYLVSPEFMLGFRRTPFLMAEGSSSRP